jgi:hypothetical protein
MDMATCGVRIVVHTHRGCNQNNAHIAKAEVIFMRPGKLKKQNLLINQGW